MKKKTWKLNHLNNDKINFIFEMVIDEVRE